MTMSNSNIKNILILLTGSIACYKACSVISKLKQQGHKLKVVMSPSSLEFIGAATIEGLIGEAPITSMYTSGNVMDHINLARWADLILVAPATANYINKIAYGIGDDLLSTLFLAHDFEKPFLIAPAMNTKMYLHPTTQESIARLKKWNVEILETASGVLACGEIGSGRLLEPELIVKEVETHLANITPPDVSTKVVKSQPNTFIHDIHVLITAGGTSEAIDDVRVITNRSTGKTSAALADALIESGFKISFLHSKNSVLPQFECKKISFESFQDLDKELKNQLTTQKFNFIIHAAAVSDYSVSSFDGKINSDENEISLTLKKNPKLITQIKNLSPQSQLIGFKLTSKADENTIEKKISSLFENSKCDYVVQNDWSKISDKQHAFRFYDKKSALNYTNIESTSELAAHIFKTIIQKTEAL